MIEQPAFAAALVAIALAGTALLVLRSTNLRIGQQRSELSNCDLQNRAIIESTFDSIITVDERAEIVDVNTATSKTFGESAASFFGLSIDELIIGVVDEQVTREDRFSDVLLADGGWPGGTIEVIAQGLDGRQFLADVTVIPTRYGNKSNRIVFAREITDRVLARKALQESEEKYRDLFEQMLEGVYRSLEDGTILATNPAMVRLLGYSSEDELCRHASARDLFWFPEQHDALITSLGHAGKSRSQVLKVRRKDGSRCTVLANVKAIQSRYDDGVVYQGTFSDISELQRTTYALRDREELFRALAENSPDVVTVIAENAEILYCSPSVMKVIGREASERIGKSVFDHVHADDLEVAKRSINDCLRNLGTAKWFDFRLRHADGSTRYMEAVATAFVNSDGELQGVINSRDISQRHRTNQQLQQAQKMQAVGQLTGGIAHDFNNLLTVIVGNLQLIQDATDDPETAELAAVAFDAAMHGADLTHRLLAFAKRQPLEPKIIDINGLVGGMETLLRRSLGESLRVTLDAERGLWLAKVDPVQLESAILNLAINARDAMGSEGELIISTANYRHRLRSPSGDASLPAGEYVRVRVTDTGAGMSEDVRKAAIEPFFTTKPDADGSGLGLSMVYGFVQQSGGHMRLDSRAGKGTRVTLYLPRSRDRSAAVTPIDKAVSAAPNNETVLVVDDNDGVRRSVANLIGKLGYTVVEATDGDTALKVMESCPVDILFSDVSMPGLSGYELAQIARDRFPDVRTLLTSGFAGEPTTTSERPVGHCGFLPKPYSKHELAKKLRAILEHHNEKESPREVADRGRRVAGTPVPGDRLPAARLSRRDGI